MRLTRREWLGGSALTAGWAMGVLPAGAQGAATYPDHDIKAICVFPAGTGGDIFVRFYAERLSAVTGKGVLVDNRAGAFGNIGTEAAAKSKPDGYTILIVPGSSTMATAVHTFKKLGFDPVKDFIPVTTLSKLSFVILVDPKLPIKTIADLTAYEKSRPGKAFFGVDANTGLITAELYNKLAGTGSTKVQYKDIQTLGNDLYAGSIDYMSRDVPWATEQIKSGKLRALAVTGGQRASALPDVPTMEEAGVKGYGAVEPWWAVFVPAGTPQPIVDKLEGYFNRIVASDEAKKFLGNLSSDSFPGNSKMLKELLDAELKRWGELVKLAGIEPQ
jgi:tripartite-type tricarboxylate transporter receptor subunit TctC